MTVRYKLFVGQGTELSKSRSNKNDLTFGYVLDRNYFNYTLINRRYDDALLPVSSKLLTKSQFVKSFHKGDGVLVGRSTSRTKGPNSTP